MVRNNLASPLLRLPAEIRNQIYEHVFFEGMCDLSSIHRGGRDRVVVLELGEHVAALSEVYKQLHAEAAVVRFAINTFDFGSNNLPKWSSFMMHVQ
jgi:hypothetical protein